MANRRIAHCRCESEWGTNNGLGSWCPTLTIDSQFETSECPWLPKNSATQRKERVDAPILPDRVRPLWPQAECVPSACGLLMSEWNTINGLEDGAPLATTGRMS